HRFNIKGRIYPAILPVESKRVAGRVIMGVTDEELQLLDAFEDVEYTRTRVEISLADSSENMLADTYVWSDAEDLNLYGEWDFESWGVNAMPISGDNSLSIHMYKCDLVLSNYKSIPMEELHWHWTVPFLLILYVIIVINLHNAIISVDYFSFYPSFTIISREKL
ncbi:hypothetical protein ACJX0J_024252, partial [Zea mays]